MAVHATSHVSFNHLTKNNIVHINVPHYLLPCFILSSNGFLCTQPLRKRLLEEKKNLHGNKTCMPNQQNSAMTLTHHLFKIYKGESPTLN